MGVETASGVVVLVVLVVVLGVALEVVAFAANGPAVEVVVALPLDGSCTTWGSGRRVWWATMGCGISL